MPSNSLDILHEESDFCTTEAALTLVSGRLLETYKNIPEEFHEMSDSQLEKIVNPGQTERLLKIKLWQEVHRAQREKQDFVLANVFRDVCSKAYFYKNILPDPDRIAYLFRKPQTYEDKANELIEYGLQRIREEVFPARLTFQDSGHIDSKGVKVLLEVIQYMDARTKGAIVQKHSVESKTLNVNVDARDVGPNGHDESIPEQLNKLRALLAEKSNLSLVDGLSGRRVIDITAEEKDALFAETKKD